LALAKVCRRAFSAAELPSITEPADRFLAAVFSIGFFFDRSDLSVGLAADFRGAAVFLGVFFLEFLVVT
jgi:hypothetical protein